MQTIGGNAFCVVSDGAKFDLRYARAAFAALAGYALLGRLEWRMFEPFPGNYVWNLSANLALYTGDNHGKVDVACRRARGAAEQGADAGSASPNGELLGLGALDVSRRCRREERTLRNR
jgi:hypothetical protein